MNFYEICLIQNTIMYNKQLCIIVISIIRGIILYLNFKVTHGTFRNK